jgi:hypothetical protein
MGTMLRDGAGDYIQTVSVRAPTNHIEVTVRGTVETIDTAGILRGHRERVPPRAYLRSTRCAPPNRAIHDLTEALWTGRTRPAIWKKRIICRTPWQMPCPIAPVRQRPIPQPPRR